MLRKMPQRLSLPCPGLSFNEAGATMLRKMLCENGDLKEIGSLQ